MFILDWQKLPKTSVPPATILAAVIPISTPHTLTHLAGDVMTALENLQQNLISPKNPQEQDVDLPPASAAVLWKHHKIAAVYHSDSGANSSLGQWLQSYGQWESTDKLIIVAGQNFTWRYRYQKEYDQGILNIVFHLQLALDHGDLPTFIANWLRRQSLVHQGDIETFFANCLETSNFAALLAPYSPQELAGNEQRQQKILQKISKSLQQQFRQYGLILEIDRMEWRLRLHTQPQPIVEPEHFQSGSLTEKIELRRFQRSLEELKHSHSADRQSSRSREKEMPLPTLERRSEAVVSSEASAAIRRELDDSTKKSRERKPEKRQESPEPDIEIRRH